MKYAALVLSMMFVGPVAEAQVPAWTHPPRLVVGVVVDQMRADYIARYWDLFGDDGLKRLVNEGAYLRDAYFPYAPTYTGPGHTSIYTGTTPSVHGIIDNDIFDRATGRTVYCVADPSVRPVGTASPGAQRSPHRLLCSTLADELERYTNGASRTVAIALKDRSAVLPAGRTGDAAYWFIFDEGVFATSSWYMDSLPAWLQAFNAHDLPDQYLKGRWGLLLPRDRYHVPLPDDNPYEETFPGTTSPAMPIDLDSVRAVAGIRAIAYTPWGNTLTTDLALAAISGEQLGADNVPDLLAISYSSTDLLGHMVGPRALELADMYARLDREVARLLDALDHSVGPDNYTLFLTADHGAVDVPAYIRDLKGSAGYIGEAVIRGAVDKALAAFAKDSSLVQTINGDQIYLDRGRMLRRGLDPVRMERLVVDALLELPEVSFALTRDDLVHEQFLIGPQRAVQNGFMPQRSGDVVFQLRPGYIKDDPVTAGKGTTHGSANVHDTHVPVILFGAGIHKGELTRPTPITDIAPTIAMILGTALPDGCSGDPLHQVIGR